MAWCLGRPSLASKTRCEPWLVVWEDLHLARRLGVNHGLLLGKTFTWLEDKVLGVNHGLLFEKTSLGSKTRCEPWLVVWEDLHLARRLGVNHGLYLGKTFTWLED